jgi:hypothetical protein
VIVPAGRAIRAPANRRPFVVRVPKNKAPGKPRRFVF